MSARSATYLLRDIEPVAREFYRRLGEGKLMSTRCRSCRETSFPPRLVCPNCREEQGWVELETHGTLQAFTTQESALRFSSPTVLALAAFGPVVLPGIVEDPIGSLSIGQAIRAEPFREPETELTLLMFRLTS